MIGSDRTQWEGETNVLVIKPTVGALPRGRPKRTKTLQTVEQKRKSRGHKSTLYPARPRPFHGMPGTPHLPANQRGQQECPPSRLPTSHALANPATLPVFLFARVREAEGHVSGPGYDAQKNVPTGLRVREDTKSTLAQQARPA